MEKFKIETLLKKLNYWDNENQILENGTQLICKVPHVAPMAYFHTIYNPLEDDKIIFLEEKLGFNFPLDFVDFLKYTNGISLFSNNISIYGYVDNINRSNILDFLGKPYDIINENLKVPKKLKKDYFIFGGYQEGYELYFKKENLNNSRVYLQKAHLIKLLKNMNLFIIG